MVPDACGNTCGDDEACVGTSTDARCAKLGGEGDPCSEDVVFGQVKEAPCGPGLQCENEECQPRE